MSDAIRVCEAILDLYQLPDYILLADYQIMEISKYLIIRLHQMIRLSDDQIIMLSNGQIMRFSDYIRIDDSQIQITRLSDYQGISFADYQIISHYRFSAD